MGLAVNKVRGVPRRPAVALAGAVAFVLVASVTGVAPAGAAEATVDLGDAESYAVLAGSTVTNTGPSVVRGDLGVSPGSAVTGFPPGVVDNGTIHAADAHAASAQAALTTAYNDAAGRSSTGPAGADLGGQTLVSGVYTGGALQLTGELTLDASGDPDAVWIFQASSTLTTASGSSVELIGDADPCNVFWQVGSSATIGTNSDFVGNVLAQTAVTVNTGADVDGRLLARTAAVTLDDNTVARSTCDTSPAATTTTSSSATSSSTSSTTSSSTTTTTSVTDTTGPEGAPVDRPGAGTGGAPGAPSDGTAATVTGASPPASDSSNDLPRTGAFSGTLALVGAVTTAAGVLVVTAERRRRVAR